MSARWNAVLEASAPIRVGSVQRAVGLSVDVVGLECAVGDVLRIAHATSARAASFPADSVVATDPTAHTLVEVVAVDQGVARCMPLTGTAGLSQGDAVLHTGGPLLVPSGPGLLGRVLDGLGRPIDGKGPLTRVTYMPLMNEVPHPLTRARISRPLATSVRVLDTLITLGRGQRMGLFAGSGVGKSTLLSMIARGTDAAVSVVALVGERGREVREFIDDDLGPEGLARSVVVVATSDQPALVRVRSAFVATAIASQFRSSGTDSVLMMDSLTRVAMAQREIGLSVGEPPATRGYPPSTFAILAQLLEQAGNGEHGSVTGIYTVLVDGDDHNEPVADAARSILDGHVVLDRSLAVKGHFPAVDALASISRVASKVLGDDYRHAALQLRRFMAARAEVQDLLDVGAYVQGVNPEADAAIALHSEISAFLRQSVTQVTGFDEAWVTARQIVASLENHTHKDNVDSGGISV
ncbi:FliI/YscN family ATPase [Timonella senegalensis]|uniref:FliI/YscN family ATPase n=1 Tax=Timonella senegalensis TaxID=1465825 RepID=UPI0028AE6869|nr:FliI/YscN family ATPase [Timonella senegalensis]